MPKLTSSTILSAKLITPGSSVSQISREKANNQRFIEVILKTYFISQALGNRLKYQCDAMF